MWNGNNTYQTLQKMQSLLLLSSPTVVPCGLSIPKQISTLSNSSRFASIRSNSLAVNYNSTVSVFPAEACETVGGDTCLADMYPEVKLKTEVEKPKQPAIEAVEREYLDYTDSKTVLLGDACEHLGGEFCTPPYSTT